MTYKTVARIMASKATRHGLEFQFQTSCPGNFTVLAWVNVAHPNPLVVAMGLTDLGRIVSACGLSHFVDSEELHNRELVLTFKPELVPSRGIDRYVMVDVAPLMVQVVKEGEAVEIVSKRHLKLVKRLRKALRKFEAFSGEE